MTDAGPRTHISRPGDAPWREPEGRDGQVRAQFHGLDNEAGPWVMRIQFEPGYSEPAHWHEHDTIYIPTRGALIIEGEGRVGVGDVRWVRAGTYYGPEAASDEGCEFWLIACGPPGYHSEPPNPTGG